MEKRMIENQEYCKTTSVKVEDIRMCIGNLLKMGGGR
jgi:hypothetical protein